MPNALRVGTVISNHGATESGPRRRIRFPRRQKPVEPAVPAIPWVARLPVVHRRDFRLVFSFLQGRLSALRHLELQHLGDQTERKGTVKWELQSGFSCGVRRQLLAEFIAVH